MSGYVVDASAAAEYLLRTPLGLKLAPLMEDALLLSPELLDVEVLSVLWRAVLRGRLAEERARTALDDLGDWPIVRLSHASLLEEAWQYRHNFSAYDAFYVAAAHRYEAPLLTADGPLARAPVPGVVVHNVRID